MSNGPGDTGVWPRADLRLCGDVRSSGGASSRCVCVVVNLWRFYASVEA